MSHLSEHDLAVLSTAVSQLEQPGLAGKLAAAVGTPVEKLLQRLPESIQNQVNGVTEESLSRALWVAIKTLDGETAGAPWNLSHKLAATLTGVTGGLFGAPALFAELPVTTVIMLRSIADIARSKGEDLSDPVVRLACLEVFALGSGGKYTPDEAVEIVTEAGEGGHESEGEEEFIRATYFVARAAMAQQVAAAADVLKRGAATVAKGGSSPLTRLISRIATRFGIAVSEKAAAQAVPIVGAIGGGLVNVLFMDHFQDTAEAHFAVRRLEREYGASTVRREYESLAAEIPASKR